MVLQASGTITLNQVANEYYPNINAHNMNAYLGTSYYKGPIPGFLGTLPSSSLGLQNFYATSPDNEWPFVDPGGGGK